MTRLTFQSLRSRKARIKAQFFKKSDDANEDPSLLGTLLLDLREAVPRSEVNQDDSYFVHASWKKLMNPSVPPGRSPPSVRIALVLEPSVAADQEGEVKQTTDAANIEEEKLKDDSVVEVQNTKLEPVLNEKQGYFHIGPEAKATHTFMFNVFICFGRNVHSVSCSLKL